MNVFGCLGFGTNVKVIEKLKRISYRFSRKFHFLHKERGYRDLGYILCMDLLHSLVDSCTPELVTLYLYQNYGQISSKTFFFYIQLPPYVCLFLFNEFLSNSRQTL